MEHLIEEVRSELTGNAEVHSLKVWGASCRPSSRQQDAARRSGSIVEGTIWTRSSLESCKPSQPDVAFKLQGWSGDLWTISLAVRTSSCVNNEGWISELVPRVFLSSVHRIHHGAFINMDTCSFELPGYRSWKLSSVSGESHQQQWCWGKNPAHARTEETALSQ